jgi:hypothetical protein
LVCRFSGRECIANQFLEYGDDKIEALNPRAVVASHKRPENDDNPRIIEQTRQYIRDFERLAETTKTAQELYGKMLELYPSRVNPGWALWSSARAVKS